jgi:integrator complex subunit 2
MTSVTLSPPTVSARLFRAIQTVAVDALAACSDTELRPALATLVRMSLIASLDGSERCSSGRNAVLQVLSRIELVNNLVALLSIDFHALETDVRKEQQLRAKVGSVAGDSVLISNLTLGPALEFERSDATRRLRLVLSELLAIMGQVRFVMLHSDLKKNGERISVCHVLDQDSNRACGGGRG